MRLFNLYVVFTSLYRMVLAFFVFLGLFLLRCAHQASPDVEWDAPCRGTGRRDKAEAVPELRVTYCEAMDCDSEHQAPDAASQRMLASYMQQPGGAQPLGDPTSGEGSHGGEGDGDSEHQLATLKEAQ
jgi:hypothetical protein